VPAYNLKMSLARSPVGTRNNKANKDKSAASQSQSSSTSSLSTADISPEIMTAVHKQVQTAVEAALMSDAVINDLVTRLATKVSSLINESLKNSLEEARSSIRTLEAELGALREDLNRQNDQHKKRADELEQYTRRNSLRIFGVTEREQEDTDQLVVDLAAEKLGINISRADIDRSHRVGRTADPADKKKPRAILVKFATYQVRRQVFNNKKKLKGSNVTVREDLTAHRAGLVRRATALYGTKNVWTTDGRVCWVDGHNVRGAATWELPEVATEQS